MRPLILLAILCVPSALVGQEPPPPTPRALFEAGSYQQLIDAVGSHMAPVPPDVTYLSAHSYLKLERRDEARQEFAKLHAGVVPEMPTPWSLVGESAVALVDLNGPLAVEKASKAVAMAPEEFFPNYQLGLALSAVEQWQASATAFEKAAMVDPAFAYAHYYAGLAYSRLRQLDRMAKHFEYFLTLAPSAPERPAVMTLMRSIRGI